MYVSTLRIEKISFVKVKQREKIVKCKQRQIISSIFVCAFMAICICLTSILRIFLVRTISQLYGNHILMIQF